MENNYVRKDDKWLDAPGYCVECDNLYPLNKAGVCTLCWEKSGLSQYKEWREDLKNSEIFYKSSKAYLS